MNSSVELSENVKKLEEKKKYLFAKSKDSNQSKREAKSCFKKLKACVSALVRKRIQLRRKRIMDRKQQTRKKIQLGGLVVKAGLDYLHPQDAHVIYGMLLDCKEHLHTKPETKKRWACMGRGLLMGM